MSHFSIFKDLEAARETRVKENSLSVFRLDGSNFSSYTTQFEKPFSDAFEFAMNLAAEGIYKNVFPNALVVYVGSDEISIICSSSLVELPYGGRISKLLSLAAAHATAAFSEGVPGARGIPAFDARVIEFEDAALIREYITWRRLDTRKNAISMAAGSLRSHKELMGVSTSERIGILEGTPFERIAEGTFNGRFMVKTEFGVEFVPATQELAEELCASARAAHETITALKLANAAQ